MAADSSNGKSILNRSPLEWPLKYWLVIASVIASPQAASLGLNFIEQRPENLRSIEAKVEILAEQTERLTDVNQQIVEVQIRHDEKMKAMKQELDDIKVRLREIER